MIPESPPEAEIRRRIRAAGPLTWAEFMELALYWPDGGYYSRQPGDAEPYGASGDYYTSPLAHPAFGALLAVQLRQLWQLMDAPDPFYVVELGAGNGLLCRDILAAAAAMPDNLPLNMPDGFARCLRYLCLDRRSASPGYEPALPSVNRIATSDIPLRNLRGCIISNELLDAFPVHQVKQENGELREVYITLQPPLSDPSAPFATKIAELSAPALADWLAELGVVLAEGQTAEINLGLDAWAAAVADSLAAGFVLTLDYGRPAAELYSAELRPRGTLTTYYRHVQTDSPLRNIGRQDITAQVDFTSVVNAGRRAGLVRLGNTTQRQFLRNLGLDRFRRRLAATPLPPGPAQANHAGLSALARPGGLGDFQVLAQGKNVGRPKLWGLEPSPSVGELADAMPLPLLTRRHLSLPNAWPAAEQEFELDLQQLWPGQERQP